VILRDVNREALSPTPRSTVQRGKKRAVTDREALDAVLDAGLICHLSVVVNGAPLVLPTGYGRDGNTLYLHGSSGARSLRTATEHEICVAVTHLDGIVYARSVFHHSVNYRSAIIHGSAQIVTDENDKLEGLRVLTDHLAPGSWSHTRPPTRKELAQTTVLTLDLTEASVKIRSGPPSDDDEDVEGDIAWAGVLPIVRTWGDPVPSPDLGPSWDTPVHVKERISRAVS
jgi:nitroimidazol reductase NimA-like FMN-containing flavoprotein (pyridoxamine 5'-phosphate oxidase superfamily)